MSEPLTSIAQERNKRIQSRLNQGAGALVDFRRLINNGLGTSDYAAVTEALEYAATMDYHHAGMSSVTYLAHPLRVAEMVLSLVPRVPVETLIIAMLHNVLEVGNVPVGDLEQRFGAVVLQALKDLTVDRDLQWDADYKREYYQRLADGYRGACIVKVVDKLDNMFVLGLNPDGEIRRRYLEEIENYVLPMARQDIPSLTQYLTDLIEDCRRCGYLEQDAARITAAEQH
jgi:(p)ppGpp synthase/HD superfamily hydrolase